MTLKEKIDRLHNVGDIVLYRWMTGRHRVAKDYILLSTLRFETLFCTKEKIWFSSAAPCLYIDRGRPHIVLKDHDVLAITSGRRQGMTIIPSMLQEDETATEARHCRWLEVEEEHCPKWLSAKVMAMCTSPVYPVSRVVCPEFFRISKNAQSLKPYFSHDMLECIGAKKGDSVATMLAKFHANLEMFGTFTNDGYIIANDKIVTGGCCVAQSKGIGINGSMVHQIPMMLFLKELSLKHWEIGPFTNKGKACTDDLV